MEVTDEILDYVKVVAEHFFPEPALKGNAGLQYKQSLAPYFFCERYNSGKISESTKTDRYYNNIELQEILKARDLDVEKTWYLCLLAKDYAQTLAVSKMEDKIFDMLKLSGYISKSLKNNEDCSLVILSEGKKILSIKDPKSLIFLCESVLANLPHSHPIMASTVESGAIEKYKCYYFDILVEYFLGTKKPNGVKKVDRRIISSYKDSRFLSGILIYASGLSDDKELLDFYKDDSKDDGELPKKKQRLNGKISGVKDDLKKAHIINTVYGMPQ